MKDLILHRASRVSLVCEWETPCLCLPPLSPHSPLVFLFRHLPSTFLALPRVCQSPQGEAHSDCGLGGDGRTSWPRGLMARNTLRNNPHTTLRAPNPVLPLTAAP